MDSAKPLILSAEFLTGAAGLKALPDDTDIPEIAFAGRSNVGKSTLINAITGRKGLARSSATPGRTREINLFELVLRGEEGTRRVRLADLPGFGYARIAKTERERLSGLIAEYLSRRGQLEIICLLNDCRRDPEQDELTVRNLAASSGRHLLPVLTKIDKLGQRDRHRRVAAVAASYGLEPQDLLLTGRDGKGVAAFWERIVLLL